MESQTGSLTLGNLVNPKEKTYFYILVTVAVILWPIIVVFGFFFVGILALIGWLTHGLLVARLRSESVLITPQQYPELHTTFIEVCQRLGVTKVPELYILQSGGILNAFATKHAGRNFVVIYSSFIEILGASSPMMKFLIGHEIGHIQRKHLTKRLLLAPATFVPMVGEAYHRACEATCDRYGAFASNDLPSSMLALTVLASGREASHLDTSHFAAQHYNVRDFFVSWHELISTYPTLSQRVAFILGFHDPRYARLPGRNAFAYPMALLFSIFSVKNIILVYISVVAISVLITLGHQVKDVEKKIQEKAQSSQDTSNPSPSSNGP